MKITIIILLIILIAVVIYIFHSKSNNTKVAIGDIDDTENHIGNLMQSTNEYSFLIIKIQGTDDFIQFTGDTEGVQLDFPLVTEVQKQFESAFKNVARDLDLKVIENKGSDGSRFLDIDINGNANEISNIVKPFIKKLFNVDQSTKLEFEYDL